MAIPTITEYAGEIPDRRTQGAEDFTAAAITWTDYQASNLIPDINATVFSMNEVSAQVSADADLAQSSAEAAQAAGNYQGVWTVSATVLKGQTWSYDNYLWISNIDGAGQPQENANWQLMSAARAVKTQTSQSVQGFIDSFALKIFQSPTDGLTEINTRTLLGGEVYEVRKVSDDSLATIYSDAAGTTEIVQNGTSNVSSSAGAVEFYITDGDYYITVSSNSTYFNTFRESAVSVGNYNALDGSKTQANDIYNALLSGITFKIPNKITSLSEVFAKWHAGEKFPVCFFGDSTTDGATTTTDGTTLATIWNRDKMVGGNVPDNFNDDHDDSEVPNAYANVLQRLARLYTGNSTLRTYNAGYRGQQMFNGWATTNVYNAVYGNAAYADTKVIFINFGLNDVNAAAGDLSNLEIKTKNYLEALVLDAYARGVQPVIATTVVSSYATSPYPNGDVISVIDGAKKLVAEKYGLELIDLAKAQLDYTYYNGQSENYWTISDDSLHLNDRGNLLQAQYLLKELAGQMILNIRSGDNYIDLTHPAMRLKGNDGTSLSKNFGLSRGMNQRYRTLTVTDAYYTALAGGVAFDLWVWNDTPSCGAIYCKFLDENINGTNISDYSLAPKIDVSSNFGTANDTYATTKSMLDPNLVGGQTGGGRAVVESYLTNLKYGLNRITMPIPTGVDTSFLVGTGIAQIGYMKFETDNIENKYPTITFGDSAITDENYKEFSGLLGTTMTKSGVDNVKFKSYSNENRFSLVSDGDYVEFKINADWEANTGVVLCYNTYDNRLSSTPIEDKQRSITAGSYLSLDAAGISLRVRLFGASGVESININPFVGGDDAFASYVGKDLVLKMTRVNEKTFRFDAFDGNYTQIGTGQVTGTTTQDYVLVRNCQSGYVGGLTSGSASINATKVNSMSYRARNI